jgi:hypothetical protein
MINGSDPISGSEVLNMQEPTLESPEAQQILQEMGQGALASAPEMGALEVYLMGTDKNNGFPTLLASTEGGSVGLSPTQIYANQGLDLQVSEIGEGLYGTVAGSYLGVGGSITYDGEFYWHSDSRCAFYVKLWAAQNSNAP